MRDRARPLVWCPRLRTRILAGSLSDLRYRRRHDPGVLAVFLQIRRVLESWFNLKILFKLLTLYPLNSGYTRI